MSIDKESLSEDIVRQTIRSKLNKIDLVRESQTILQLACRIKQVKK